MVVDFEFTAFAGDFEFFVTGWRFWQAKRCLGLESDAGEFLGGRFPTWVPVTPEAPGERGLVAEVVYGVYQLADAAVVALVWGEDEAGEVGDLGFVFFFGEGGGLLDVAL